LSCADVDVRMNYTVSGCLRSTEASTFTYSCTFSFPVHLPLEVGFKASGGGDQCHPYEMRVPSLHHKRSKNLWEELSKLHLWGARGIKKDAQSGRHDEPVIMELMMATEKYMWQVVVSCLLSSVSWR
jgi:hypothetical protein